MSLAMGGRNSVNSQSIKVEIVDATSRLNPSDREWVEVQAAKAMALLKLNGSLSARVIDDSDMAMAHAEFCGVEGTTDVITFDLTDPADNAPANGRVEADLLLCIDEAARQAGQRGHETRRELLLYMIHGLLHCLGHDDHDEAGFKRMHAEEDRILAEIGIGPTFATPTAGGKAAS